MASFGGDSDAKSARLFFKEIPEGRKFGQLRCYIGPHGMTLWDYIDDNKFETVIDYSGYHIMSDKKVLLSIGLDPEEIIPKMFENEKYSDGTPYSDSEMKALISGTISSMQGAFEIKVGQNGSGSLLIRDEKGNLRSALGPTKLRHTKTGSTEIRSESSIVFFDEKGNVLWSAP